MAPKCDRKDSNICFDIAEHGKVMELVKDFSLPLNMYYFFKKNLPSKIAPAKIAIILNDYYQSDRFNTEATEVNGSLQSAFGEFQINFFSNTFEIVDSSAQAV